MKRISKLRFVTRTLTYNKGIEGLEKTITCTGVMSGRTMLINNIEGFQHGYEENQSYQVKICETDGIFGCEIGNWISLRKKDGFIFFIPAFSLIEETKFAPHDFFPPSYMMKSGVLVFLKETYDQIDKIAQELPKYNEILELTVDEIIQVHNFESFVKIFGKPYPSEEELSPEVGYTILSDDSQAIKNEQMALLSSKSFKLVNIDRDDQEIEIFTLSNTNKKHKIAVLSENKIHLTIGDFKVVSTK